ncbi:MULTISPECIES: hypothetical protein [Streptomyces]|uniref:Nucleoid-associated protein YejK n=2 Tax=Streptomyces murinus TaxID=33900 RepID=A0A7W3NTV9_STRMR|nr:MULTISPECIES: hypothetical protein [Streptomyces]MBA9056301.1 nucleoid-associated protein YejK [Streptomyces murinus]UWW95840.1 hypothetical protein GO605_07875 [Streptomyces murinus]
MASAKGEQPKSVRYSVTLVPPAARAVDDLVEATGLNKADVINRAVQIYAFLEERMREGKVVLLRGPDEKEERVHIV